MREQKIIAVEWAKDNRDSFCHLSTDEIWLPDHNLQKVQ